MDTSVPPPQSVENAPPVADPVATSETSALSSNDGVANGGVPPETEATVPAADSTPGPPVSAMPVDLSRVAQDLQIRKVQVEAVVQLLDDGNTAPFIARYRKVRTGGLSEEMIRRVRYRVARLRHLSERKEAILKSIAARGSLADELRDQIIAAEHPKRLEDLYQPFKPRKRSPAAEARDKGLEPLALAIWHSDPVAANVEETLSSVVNPDKGLTTADEVSQGVGHVLAEVIADKADLRGALRMVLWDTGRIAVAKGDAVPEGKGAEYKDYFQFVEPVRHIPPHRVLAINRGERENVLRIRFEFDADLIRRVTADYIRLDAHPHRERLLPIVEDGVNRLLLPSLEREIRRDLTERAQDHAIAVFARNLRSLLLQRPLTGKRVLAIDPGFRSGCKIAVIDEGGELIEHAVIHPHHPQRRVAEGRHKLEELVRKHQTSVVAIGNGTASRETEELVAGLIAEFEARRRGEITPERANQPDVAPPAPSVTSEIPLPAPGDRTAFVAAAPAHTFAFTIMDATPAVGQTAAADADQPTPVEGFSLTSDGPPPFATPGPVGPPVAASCATAPQLSLDGLLEPPSDLAYVMVNEAGASDYATSAVGREDLPNCDAALRSTISIGRRLQDPLRELVKIDPQHVGVGLYQHDVHPKHLKQALSEVVESCVNYVGADVNKAGASLLRHISGLNATAAREMVECRKRIGAFGSRAQLQALSCLAAPRWVQAIGFLKVAEGVEPLDNTWIHPESYALACRILEEIVALPEPLHRPEGDGGLHQKMASAPVDEIARRVGAEPATVRDIIRELRHPCRDPREDSPPPVLKTAVLRLEDLRPGMELKGTVLNVVPFGAFVDVGLKDSGLVHISQMANRYIRSPHEVVAVGDVVSVWVLTVDSDRRRASLTMIPPGAERLPADRRGRPERPADSERAPARVPPPHRGPRPGRRPARAIPVEGRPQDSAVSPTLPRPSRQAERKPPQPRPLPKLTQAKKEGKEYLTTLGELAAFFKARESPKPPPEQAPAD
jgi:uncharacterized protein